MKSTIGEARQGSFGVNAAVMAIGEGDIQAVAEVGHANDGDARKRLRKTAVEARAGTMRAFASRAKLVRCERDAAALRCGERKLRQIRAEFAVVHDRPCCCCHLRRICSNEYLRTGRLRR